MKTYKDLILELSLAKASDFATQAHDGQIRKSSGEPYVMHPTAVYSFLKKIGIKDKNVLVAAYLHDTIEDSPTTKNKLEREFNKDVARIVKELSSSPRGIQIHGKPQYLAHKMIKMSPDSLLIKLADRWHNLQDMNVMPKQKAEKYVAQTVFILGELRRKAKLNKLHKKVIRSIEKHMGTLNINIPTYQ